MKKRIGYGQVEPNHLSAKRTGQIYAQLPAADGIEVLENGQFVKYDYANKAVNFTGEGEWMLVFNEVKLYENRETYKDFALKAANAVDGVIVPRVLKTNIGDIFTTNCVEGEIEGIKEGDILAPNAKGYLEINADAKDMKWQVVKVYTLADGQDAVKVMRIA
jgi:hypothetical protein